MFNLLIVCRDVPRECHQTILELAHRTWSCPQQSTPDQLLQVAPDMAHSDWKSASPNSSNIEHETKTTPQDLSNKTLQNIWNYNNGKS